MQYTVIGDANQCVVAQMTLGDEILAEVGAMVLLSDGVALEAAANSAVMRISDMPVASAPVPLTHFRCLAQSGVVAFAAPYSGELLRNCPCGERTGCAPENCFCSAQETLPPISDLFMRLRQAISAKVVLCCIGFQAMAKPIFTAAET